MPLLVTSASGANGDGFGALLSFELDGKLRGIFIDDDRIVDPRGLAVDPNENLLFLNSGADRVLAISSHGRIVRDTGRIEGLNPGGGNFGPGGRYFVSACAANAQSSPCRPASMLPWSMSSRPGSYLFLEDLLLVKMAGCSSPQESGPAKAITPYWPSLQPHLSSPRGWSRIPN
jgi:hypothetical protein